ncbi:MAG: glutathione S-transferase [Steroidobacteraceae bacterium]
MPAKDDTTPVVAPGTRTLYGAPGSGSAAVEMGLRAAGLEYRVVRAATWEPGPGLEALRRVNPLGQIPTLVEPDGSVLTESAAILIHLALAHPAAGLLPADPAARARALRGLVYIAANCYSAISICDYPERWTTATDDDARDHVRQAARANLHRAWDLFADAYGDDPVLGGEPPGALAFLTVIVSQWSGARKHLAKARPACHAVIERLEQHPRLAPVLTEHRAK